MHQRVYWLVITTLVILGIYEILRSKVTAVDKNTFEQLGISTERIDSIKKYQAKNRFPKRQVKRILWYSPQQIWVNKWAAGKWNHKMFEHCPVKDCTISFGKSLYNVSDAVIFDGFTLSTKALAPKPRDQIWILFLNDSPTIYRFTSRYKNCNGKFNWTLSNRRDSDFYFNMGKFNVLTKQRKVDFKNILSTKQKLVAIVTSNCHTSSKRQEFIQELQKRIQVDIYGGCGHLKCDDNFLRQRLDAWSFSNSSKEHDKCFSMLENTYKFYLSFENSFCRDYITEKGLHIILQRNMVPIVRGGANYSIYHPPHSSINTEDFRSVEELIDYLLLLDKDSNRYLQYLSWKQFYETENMGNIFGETMCEICARLHNADVYTRVYEDIYSWIFQPDNKPVCWTSMTDNKNNSQR